MIEFCMSLERALCMAYEAKQSTVTAFPLNLLLVLPALRGNKKRVRMCLHTHTRLHTQSLFLPNFHCNFADLGGLDSSDKASEKYLKV